MNSANKVGLIVQIVQIRWLDRVNSLNAGGLDSVNNANKVA